MARYLYVVAGEHSGDAHGAGLLQSLAQQVDDLKVRGVGGSQMSELTGGGVRDWVEDAAVMGIWEVLKRYGWFKEQFEIMMGEVREMKPEVLLLIDYPGFNLRFAKAVLGREPIVADIDENKRKLALANGACAAVDPREKEARKQVMDLTGGSGVAAAILLFGRIFLEIIQVVIVHDRRD